MAGAKGAKSTIRRVSVSKEGVEGNRASTGPRVSHEGRFVAFKSDATNLVTSSGKSSWYVADTTDDTIVAMPAFKAVNGFLSPSEVLGHDDKTRQFVIQSLPVGEARFVSLPDRVKREQPLAFRNQGKRLFFLTRTPLDEQRDTNNKADLYVVDLPESLIDLAKAPGQSPNPSKVVEADSTKVEGSAKSEDGTQAPVSKGKSKRNGAKSKGKPLAAETLNRVAGEYELSGKDATGGATTMTLLIKPDGTASLDSAKEAGLDSLAVTGQDSGQVMTLSIAGKNDKADVNLTMILLGGGDATCIYVETEPEGSSKFFQMKAKKKATGQ